MFGVTSDGKIIVANKDFSIRIPYGAAYEPGDAQDENHTVLTITRFDELPANYTASSFQPQIDARKCDVLNICLTHDLEDEHPLRQMKFPDFLDGLKRKADERFAWAAVGELGKEDGSANYRTLKVVQNTPEIQVGYVTRDLFVAINFTIYIFTKNREYSGKLKIERQAQKFKRTEMFVKSLLSSVKASS